MNDSNVTRYIICVNLPELLTRSDYITVLNVLFARRNPSEIPHIRSCVYNLAVGTQTKIKIDSTSGHITSILISWRVDKSQCSLPRFKSDLITCLEESEDRHDFKNLQRKSSFHLVGTNKVRLISVAECKYLERQLLEHVQKYQKLEKIELK